MAKLNQAWLCVDCEEIFDGNGYSACPVCGSETIVPVAAWLPSMSDAGMAAWMEGRKRREQAWLGRRERCEQAI